METRENHQIDRFFYRKPSMQLWMGRTDGKEKSQLRWHQHVQPLDLSQQRSEQTLPAVALLGFACDEGVKRNRGRVGAAKGPDAIRKALCNLPVFYPNLLIYDAGDVHCPNDNLEAAQQNLAIAVVQILQLGALPILVGGGHEITYGHYCGIRDFMKTKRTANIGIVNFDAHFDNRKPGASGPSSGTGFWQIAEDCKQKDRLFHYLALGIQKTSNTVQLFDTAHQTNTRYALARHFHTGYKYIPEQLITTFCQDVEQVYITIDLDVFAAAYSPGVSAAAYNGILPDAVFFDSLDLLFDSGKVISLDIAELNPEFDIDSRTSKLAAELIFYAAERLAGKKR